MDRVHAAGRGARALLLDDRVIGAYVDAAAALDAFFLIDVRTAVVAVERDRALGAYLNARVRQAALATLGHHDLIFLAGVAGKLDDVDQRRGVVGLLTGRSFDIVRHRGVLGRVAAGQTHRQTQPLADDRAFEEDVVAVVADFTRNDLVRERLDAAVGRPLSMVGHARHFAENLAADLLNAGLYASHNYNIPLVKK